MVYLLKMVANTIESSDTSLDLTPFKPDEAVWFPEAATQPIPWLPQPQATKPGICKISLVVPSEPLRAAFRKQTPTACTRGSASPGADGDEDFFIHLLCLKFWWLGDLWSLKLSLVSLMYYCRDPSNVLQIPTLGCYDPALTLWDPRHWGLVQKLSAQNRRWTVKNGIGVDLMKGPSAGPTGVAAEWSEYIRNRNCMEFEDHPTLGSPSSKGGDRFFVRMKRNVLPPCT